MTKNQSPTVYFLSVTDNTTKLNSICNVIQDHFYKKETILISVASDEAAVYIDTLLWKMPEESFIPHLIAKNTVNERVVITTSQTNLNQAGVLVNLCSTMPTNINDFNVIYELMDRTHPEKEILANKRKAAYEAAGLNILDT